MNILRNWMMIGLVVLSTNIFAQGDKNIQQIEYPDSNFIELIPSGFKYEFVEVSKNGKETTLESTTAAPKLIFDSWHYQQWKKFKFPGGNEHYTAYWAQVHLIDASNGDVLNWHFIEARTADSCYADGSSYNWRHETRSGSHISFGSGSGLKRSTVDGYRLMSTFIKFRRQDGSGWNWKVRPDSCK